jgi:hypothetical protein
VPVGVNRGAWTARRIGDALHRARWPIASIAAAYALSLAVGIVMVRMGNEFALVTRDAIVGDAVASDPASLALRRGDAGTAAVIDFAQNVALGAVPTTVMGLAIIGPYPIAAYRGWVGGIVSSRADRSNRLDELGSATYYLAVIVLQLLPYSLTGGAGVALGLAFIRPRRAGQARILGLPREQLADVGWIYALSIPLFFVAAVVEFGAA